MKRLKFKKVKKLFHVLCDGIATKYLFLVLLSGVLWVKIFGCAKIKIPVELVYSLKKFIKTRLLRA
jgi:hypothetical protein